MILFAGCDVLSQGTMDEGEGIYSLCVSRSPLPHSIVLPLPLAAQTLPPLATRVSSAAGEDTTTALREGETIL